MRSKVAKALRARARANGTNEGPVVVNRKGTIVYPARSYRRIYQDMKRAYKRFSRGNAA